MKKTLLTVLMAVCGLVATAQNYGILVNGKMYYAGEYTTEFEGFTQYLAHVQVNPGDYCQLYDVDNKVAWAVALNSYSEPGFVYDATTQHYNVSVSGCYDFYIKLKWEADELYIGNGSDCGEGVDITKEDPRPSYNGAAPAQCPDVVLQAFYWDSYQSTTAKDSKTSVYGRTKWVDHLNGANGTSAEEIGQWFDLIWLPPMSKSTGGTGYHPTNYGVLDGDWGTKSRLQELIKVFHKNGARVVADIVINHADAQQGWCNFGTYNFGNYGSFTPDGSYICRTDEVNTSSAAGSCRGFATGNDDDGYGDEANYAASRDWDHTNPEVQAMFKAYLKWMRNEVQVDGFRYDYCKGFNNGHINDYNKAAQPYFSVMEMWDGNTETLKYHLGEAGWNTLTFDFAMKYTAFNNGIASDNYCALKGAGLPGAGVARYAVTFLDSHDSFLRDGNEFCGEGNSMTVCRDKLMQCYAYLLSMPGVPLVFYPHWVTFKEDIKKMINARYKTGVHSESGVSDECGNGFYKATISGTNGEIRLLVGPNSGYDSTPSGYKLAVKGVNYGVYYKETSARGDKNTERTDRTEGVESVQPEKTEGTKYLRDGKLFIRVGETVYDVQGNRIQ